MLKKILDFVTSKEEPPKSVVAIDPKLVTSNAKNAQRPSNAECDKVGPVREFRLKPGYSFNPALRWPANGLCFCSSGKKFKKCHRDKLSPVIETKKVKETMEALQTCAIAMKQGVKLD